MPRKGKSTTSDNSATAEQTNAALEANLILAMNGRNKWKEIEMQMEQAYHSMVHTGDCRHETCSHILQEGNLTLEKNEVTLSSYQICNSNGLNKINTSNVNYAQSSHGIQEHVDVKVVAGAVVGNNTLCQDQESPGSNKSPDQELSENKDSSCDHFSLEEHVHHSCNTGLARQEHPDFSAVRSNECHQNSSIKRETIHSLANISDDSVVRHDTDYQEDCLLNNNNNEQKTGDGMKANSKETLEPFGYIEADNRREETPLTKTTKSPRKRTLSSDEIQVPRRYGRKIKEPQSCIIQSTKNTNLSAAVKPGIVTDKESTNKSCNNSQVDTQVVTQVDIKFNSQVDTQASQLLENSSACKLHIKDSLTDDAASKEAVSRDNKSIEERESTVSVASDEAETGADNLQPNRTIKTIPVEDDTNQVNSIKEINSNTDSNTKQYSTATAGNGKHNDSRRSNNLKGGNVSKDMNYVDCPTEATSKTVANYNDTDQIQYSSTVAEMAAIFISQNNKDVPPVESAEGKQYQTISAECDSLHEKEPAAVHGADDLVRIMTDNVSNTNVPAFDNIHGNTNVPAFDNIHGNTSVPAFDNIHEE